MQDLSKPILIGSQGESFVVFFQDDGSPGHRMRWSGKVLPVLLVSDGTWLYYSQRSSESIVDVEKARVNFEFIFCWRGVWEGRIYPKLTEYWAEDIEIMAEAWSEVEKILKQRIKDENPDYGCFDE